MSERLIARSVRLPGTVSLGAVAGQDGFLWQQEHHGMAGRGEARRIELSGGLGEPGATEPVLESLRSIEADGSAPDGVGPVALGALPFEPTSPASLVVPRRLVQVLGDGSAWMTTVRPESEVGDERDGPLAEDTPRPQPDGFELSSPRSHEEWTSTIRDALSAIDRGELTKVVVAREVVVRANRCISVLDVASRLHALYPSCYVFAMGGFVGASPELLVHRRGRRVRSQPLAGTYPRSGDATADAELAAEMFSSAKERHEHRVVIDNLRAALEPLCEELRVPDEPSVMALRNVVHLATDIHGTLAEPPPSALDLVARLHPTPAVAGTPTAEALAWLAANEQLERGPYAGPVGWMDASGDGEWALGIRSALVEGHTARLFAGVGVVAGSEPARELAETQLKLQALLAALVRP